MAKWHELTDEQREKAKDLIFSLGIPLKNIPQMDFVVDDE